MSDPVTVANLIGDTKTYAYNPAGMQRAAMAAFDAIHSGTIPIVDATNPFVFALETTCVNTSAMMQQAAALTRRQYAASATTPEDLYLHMADADYANIFALPSEEKFFLIINKAQLLNALVLDSSTGISKVTIPRNTMFFAAGIPFSIQHPIDIRQLEHGGLQIVYDASQPSIFQPLTTNVIDYEELRLSDGQEFIQFGVDTQQFKIKSTVSSFDSTSGSTVSVLFEDQYYAARVFVSNSNGTWREIQVTYTDQVYDPLVPTAVLQVIDNKLLVRLPLVYITTGLISGKMRVDVYQTRGPMELQLGNYSPDDFTAEFIYLDQNDASVYVAAFTSITNISAYAKDKTSGGRSALSFSELQSRVIQNSVGPRKIPITPSQIQATLLDSGYSLVKNIDTLTDRIYWATKPLPGPKNSNLVTPANANVATVVTQTAIAQSLQGCFGHATGMTISSAALVQNVNGISSLVTKAAYEALNTLPAADRCSEVNAGKYSFTPFYYVLDTTTDTFIVRPYFLDSPTIVSRSFIQENPTTGLQASIDATYSLIKTASGFRLTLSTKSNDAYKALPDGQVQCQLAFTSASQALSGFMLGQQQTRANVKDERVFVFDLPSSYDIDASDELALPSFQTPNGAFSPRCALQQTFNVLFSTNSAAVSQTTPTNIDTFLGSFQLPAGTIGITHEQLTLSFGFALKTLWNSFRSFTAAIAYQTYVADVPRLYEEVIYETDAVSGAAFSVVDGQIVYNVLHQIGDPVLDGQNQPVFLHRAGDLVLDSDHRPIPVEDYQTVLNRSLDLVTLDGVYQFASDPVTLEYVEQIKTSLLTSLTEDLVNLNSEALEKTLIYYYPSITQGNVNAIADNNQLVNIEAAQSLKVVLYVDNLVFNNKTLIASLQASTIQAIGQYLASHATVAISQMEDTLSTVHGEDVLGVAISGLGGNRDFRVVTVTDDSTRLSIRKVLQLLPSGQLAVKEDISVVFSVHGLAVSA